MYYIEQENDELVKYEVVIDQKELEKIEYEVIENCGEIKHYHYQSDRCRHDHYDSYHIKNYHETFIKRRDLNDFYGTVLEIYEYEYDEYSDTTLVTLIDRLLKGDMSVILELKNPKIKEKKVDNRDELQKKLENILSLDMKDISTWKLEQVKKELEEYQTNEKLNRDRKSDLEYYSQVLTCIDMKEISRRTLDDLIEIEKLMNQINSLLQQVKPFFEETDRQNVCTNQYQKIIQKIHQ